MPTFCAVVNCGSRGNRDSNKFYRLPCTPKVINTELKMLKEHRRKRWIAALRRSDLTEKKLNYARICDRHFISGKPSALNDVNNLDWVPSKNMGYGTQPTSLRSSYHQTEKCLSLDSPNKEQGFQANEDLETENRLAFSPRLDDSNGCLPCDTESSKKTLPNILNISSSVSSQDTPILVESYSHYSHSAVNFQSSIVEQYLKMELLTDDHDSPPNILQNNVSTEEENSGHTVSSMKNTSIEVSEASVSNHEEHVPGRRDEPMLQLLEALNRSERRQENNSKEIIGLVKESIANERRMISLMEEQNEIFKTLLQRH